MSAWDDATPGIGIEPAAPQAPATPPRTLAEWIGELDRQREVAVQELDHDSLVRGGVAIEALIRDLRTLLDQVKLDAAILIDVAGEKRGSRSTIEIPGIGVVEVQGSYTHKNWDSPFLLRLLIEHALAKYLVPDSADDDPPMVYGKFEDMADSVATEVGGCLPLGGSLQWKLTELRKRGIDPDDYHDKTENPRKAKLPKAENT